MVISYFYLSKHRNPTHCKESYLPILFERGQPSLAPQHTLLKCAARVPLALDLFLHIAYKLSVFVGSRSSSVLDQGLLSLILWIHNKPVSIYLCTLSPACALMKNGKY